MKFCRGALPPAPPLAGAARSGFAAAASEAQAAGGGGRGTAPPPPPACSGTKHYGCGVGRWLWEPDTLHPHVRPPPVWGRVGGPEWASYSGLGVSGERAEGCACLCVFVYGGGCVYTAFGTGEPLARSDRSQIARVNSSQCSQAAAPGHSATSWHAPFQCGPACQHAARARARVTTGGSTQVRSLTPLAVALNISHAGWNLCRTRRCAGCLAAAAAARARSAGSRTQDTSEPVPVCVRCARRPAPALP